VEMSLYCALAAKAADEFAKDYKPLSEGSPVRVIPYILTGDFNTSPSDFAYSALTQQRPTSPPPPADHPWHFFPPELSTFAPLRSAFVGLGGATGGSEPEWTSTVWGEARNAESTQGNKAKVLTKLCIDYVSPTTACVRPRSHKVPPLPPPLPHSPLPTPSRLLDFLVAAH